MHRITWWRTYTVVFLSLFFLASSTDAAGAFSPSNSSISTPINPGTLDGNITQRTVILTARDNTGTALTTGGAIVVASLFSSSPVCDTSLASPSCKPICAPYNSPNTPSPACLSTTRPSFNSSSTNTSPVYAIASVTDLGTGEYRIIYTPEWKGRYDLSIYSLTSGGLTGSYYDNVWFLQTPSIVRMDPVISFQWGTGAITPYGVDYVSVRWTGFIRPAFSELYTIYALADDGVRVWIDRQLVINRWTTCCNETWSSVKLTANFYHDIIIEYQELRGSAMMELRWSSASTPKQIIPANNLFSRVLVAGTPYTNIEMRAGDPPVATTTTIDTTASALSTAIAGVSSSFTIQSRDVYGNTLDNSSTSAIWALTLVGPDASPVTSVTYVGAGVWRANYTVSVSGSYTLALTLGGVTVPGTPKTIQVSPASTSPGNSTAFGTGLTSATAGVTSYFTIQAKDSLLNNRTTGGDDVFVSLSGAAALIGTAVYTSNGQYSVFYTATKAGTYSLSVYIASQHIVGSPFTVTVTPGVLNYPSTTATGTGLTTATAGVVASFSIQARDQFGNAVVGNTSTFTATAVHTSGTSVSATITYNTTTGSKYDATYTATVAGNYQLSIINGMSGHIKNSPFTVTVVPAALAPSQSIASGTGLTTATAGIPSTFSIQSRDTFANLLTNGTNSTITATITCGSFTVNAQATYTGNGIYTVTYIPSTASSTCSLDVLASGTAISGSPFIVDVQAAKAAANASTVTGAALSGGIVGTTSTVRIQSFDSFSNTITRGGDVYNVTLTSGTTTLVATVTDYNNGTYVASYVPTKAGVYETKVQITSVGGLTGSYYTDQYSSSLYQTRADSTIDFEWGYGAPFTTGFPTDYFSIIWTGQISVPSSGVYTFFTDIAAGLAGVRLIIGNRILIDAYDPYQGSTEMWGAMSLTSGIRYDITLMYQSQDGLAGIHLLWQANNVPKSIVPSSYLYRTSDVAASPYTSTFVPATSSATTSSLSTLPSMRATQVFSFLVTLRDVYGNQQITTTETSSLAAVAVHASGNDTGVVTSVSAGMYNVTITPTHSGAYTLYVTLANVPIKSTPVTLTATPGTIVATTSTVTGTGLSGAVAGDTATFSIFARDSSNNLAITDQTSSTNAYSVSLVSGATTVTGTVTYVSGGEYRVTYRATVAGTYTVTVKLGSNQISGSPFSANVVPAAASNTTTTVVGASTSATVGVASTFDIVTKDVFGNALTSGGNQFVVELTTNTTVIRGSITDASNGNYSVSYTPTVTGTSQLSVELARAASNGTGLGLTGIYYNNRWLQGTPVLTRVDSNINQQWGTGLITPTAKQYVSVTWNGYIRPEFAAQYVFTVQVDDGARLMIDDTLVFDQFSAVPGTYSANFTFPKAQVLYPIQLDYRQNTGTANISLSWASPFSSLATQIIPTANLYPASDAVAGTPITVTVV